MSFIIGQKCVGVCDTACVDACPVDCIAGPIEPLSENIQLFIDPDTCIDCGACVPECPVEAIYESEEECIETEGSDVSVQKNYKFYGEKWNG